MTGDTAVDSSDVQADISTASFSVAVKSSRMLPAFLEANRCLDYSRRWVCACEENGTWQGATAHPA